MTIFLKTRLACLLQRPCKRLEVFHRRTTHANRPVSIVFALSGIKLSICNHVVRLLSFIGLLHSGLICVDDG